jgi:hemoglobin-like flavoprotein
MERNDLRLILTHLAELGRSPGMMDVCDKAVARLLADYPELAGQTRGVGTARTRGFATALAEVAKSLKNETRLRDVLTPMATHARRRGAGHEHMLACAVAVLEAAREASGTAWTPAIASAWCEALETCLSVAGFPRQGAIRSLSAETGGIRLAA